MSESFSSRWTFGTKITIDGDKSMTAVVTGFRFHTVFPHLVEVSWIHNGDARNAWLEDWRLAAVET